MLCACNSKAKKSDGEPCRGDGARYPSVNTARGAVAAEQMYLGERGLVREDFKLRLGSIKCNASRGSSGGQVVVGVRSWSGQISAFCKSGATERTSLR